MMPCRDARELLDSFIAQELLVETNHELLRHLTGCPECKAEVDERVKIRSRLKQAFERSADLQMRPAFATEILATLRTPASPRRGERRLRPARWLAVAASVIMAAGLGTYLMREPIPELARVAAGDHQNCAIKFALAEQPMPLRDAARRYDPAYARLETTPPDELTTAAGTLHVADRHSCVFDNHRFGHVVYRLDNHLVSVLMTRDESSETAASTLPQQLSWLPRVNGLAMASFHTTGHTVYVVSDLDEQAFRQVAPSLADPVLRLAALARTWLSLAATP
jgi:anti-sigma factor RsiW